MSGGGALSAVQRELLAMLLAEAGRVAAPTAAIAPAPRAGPAPLSSAQMRLWFLHCVDPSCAAFNVPSAVRLGGDLDRAILRRAWAEVVRRHEVLRTSFPSPRGEPVQQVAPLSPPPVPLVDLTALPGGQREAETERLARAAARRPFDLARGPLLRLTLLVLGVGEHVLLWTVHHIVFDGWSRSLLIREVVTIYSAFAAGRPSPLPELPVQYADFARWQRAWSEGPEAEAQLDYWRRKLAGLPELRLPADRPAVAAASFRGETRTFDWPAGLAAGVQEMARTAGATPFIVLLAAFKLVLVDWTGQSDVAVGTDVAGRGRLETEDLVGFFINQLVLRTDLGGDPAFDEVVARVRRTAREAYEHQELPFDRLVKEIAPNRGLDRLPLFQVKLIYQARAGDPPAVPGLEVSPLAIDSGAAQLDLTVSIHELRQGLGGWVNYSTDRFERATVEDLLWRYATLLDLALDEPTAVASRLFERLREAERARRAERAELRAAARRERWSGRRRQPASSIPEAIRHH